MLLDLCVIPRKVEEILSLKSASSRSSEIPNLADQSSSVNLSTDTLSNEVSPDRFPVFSRVNVQTSNDNSDIKSTPFAVSSNDLMMDNNHGPISSEKDSDGSYEDATEHIAVTSHAENRPISFPFSELASAAPVTVEIEKVNREASEIPSSMEDEGLEFANLCTVHHVPDEVHEVTAAVGYNSAVKIGFFPAKPEEEVPLSETSIVPLPDEIKELLSNSLLNSGLQNLEKIQDQSANVTADHNLQMRIESTAFPESTTSLPIALDDDSHILPEKNMVSSAPDIPSNFLSTGDFGDTTTQAESISLSVFVTDTFSRLSNLFYELETSFVESKSYSTETDTLSQQGVKEDADDSFQEDSAGILTLQIKDIELYNDQDVDDAGYNIQIHFQTKLGKKRSYKKPLARIKGHWICKDAISISVPYFRCAIIIDVMDVSLDRIVGRTKITAYEVSQRNADHQINASSYGPFTHLLLKDEKSKDTIGRLECCAQFQEDLYKHFWSPLVKLSPSSPEEELSLDRLGVHLIRFRAMIDFFGQCYSEYLRIMDWSDPIVTASLFLLFLYCTLYVRAEYSLSGVLFGFVLLMAKSWYRRYTGKFKEKYLTGYLRDAEQPYVPVATLRASVLGYHSAKGASTTSSLGFGFLSAASTDSIVSSSALAAVKVFLLPDRSLFIGSNLVVDTPANSNNTASSQTEAQSVTGAVSAGQSGGNSVDAVAVVNRNGTAPSSITPSSGGTSVPNVLPRKELPVGVISTSEEHLRLSEETTADGMAQFVSSFIKSSDGNKLDIITNTFEPWECKDVNAMQALLRSVPDSFQTSNNEVALVYPLLQPVKRKQDILKEKTALNFEDNKSPRNSLLSKRFAECSTERDHAFYSTWVNSTAVLKFVWVPSSTSSSFLDTSRNASSDFAYLSIRDILLYGEQTDTAGLNFEYCTWIRTGEEAVTVLEKVERSLSFDTSSSKGGRDSATTSSSTNAGSSYGPNELLVRVSLSLPPLKRLLSPSPEDRIVSEVLQGIQLGKGSHSDSASKESSNTLTVLWNMRDHVKSAQNTMAWILDMFESFKNLFNWTSPVRTLPIFISLVVLWFLTVIIPGRILLLLLGLYEFLYIILPIPDGDEIFIRFQNLLQSTPNDDDLMDIYAEERQRRNVTAETAKKVAQRTALLNASLRVRWMGRVQLKVLRRLAVAGKSSSSMMMTSTNLLDWSSVWLLVQGRRIVWWETEDHLDRGKVIINAISIFLLICPWLFFLLMFLLL